jgi:glutamate synthase (NADPH/NADH) large chain/glutamate synthase (ferredoxin)
VDNDLHDNGLSPRGGTPSTSVAGAGNPSARLSAGGREALEGGLYRPWHEHDACGTGFVADASGKRSHRTLELAVQSVCNLTHRGAVDADALSGDGAGISAQIPYGILREELEAAGTTLTADADLGVGMFFMPRSDEPTQLVRALVERACSQRGLKIALWRDVPLEAGAVGGRAADNRPCVQQALILRRAGLVDDDFTRQLYAVRRIVEKGAQAQGIKDLYIPSMSNRTVVYKGMLVAPQLAELYRDLRDPRFETALALFHQRYSTNTFPSWQLSQPFRFLAHNGEINTLMGNQNWFRAREPQLASQIWGESIGELLPIIQDGSDSSILDNVLELLVLSGRDIREAMMILIPEAWENMPHIDPEVRAFYEYHGCMMEPWDGPAAISFTDGQIAGAVLDRNGLRPARYKVTRDGLVVMGSEVGIVDIPDEEIIEKGRLGPGQMISVDTRLGTIEGAIEHNDEIKRRFSIGKPYASWVAENLIRLDENVQQREINWPDENDASLACLQAAFGYTREEFAFVLQPMAETGKEPVGSMGDDTSLPILSRAPKLLYNSFKQKFAQVTNPPIDPLREELVMSLDMFLGREKSLLEETPEHARLLHITSPLLIDSEVEALRQGVSDDFQPATLQALFPANADGEGLRLAVRSLCEDAERAVLDDHPILIITDRGVDAAMAPVPMLMAVSAVHHHLIRRGIRTRASIIAETAEARDVHQIAALLGHGASAVNPYLAFQTVRDFLENGELEGIDDLETAINNYQTAVDAGLLKIMSKMGISAMSAYQGAQIFEVLGISDEVMGDCFGRADSRIGGMGYGEIAEDVLARHEEAFPQAQLAEGGFYRFRKDADYHAFNPQVVRALQKASQSPDAAVYAEYRDLVEDREPQSLRDLLELLPLGPAVPLEEVEPIGDIMGRFNTAAMSLGALSPEAHETLAIGMNRIGGKSNTGEGGEDSRRYQRSPNGDDANSRIKQVASARFGVTPTYLAMADELEIKMAQGSKPGEGGQLPGGKVSAQIAALRHTMPGTPLISPPPHHDIYSIEDLAQLIYDLKVVNPRAKVTVKLVAEEGVGTIAAGVAKGYADVVHISGHDGGTGASPLSSIKFAGSPWELGLAETQQVLVANDLRGRIVVRTDGGLKTGRDVVIAALIGAESYNFGTAALVAIGCKMARQCHLNTCPVGVATQREDLRKKFFGTPEMVVQFFGHVADEVREILASLGARSLDEIIGRVDLLRDVSEQYNGRAALLNLKPVLKDPDPSRTQPRRSQQARNDRPHDEPLDDRILEDARAALERQTPMRLHYEISNGNRTVGARVSGEVAFRYGEVGLPDGTLEVTFDGSAGQSFGAFTHNGIRLVLTGEANDYVGKGMGGGEVVVRPNAALRNPSEHVIVGNTVLYGATGGHFFAAGRAGERFAVRNSGAKAVVEGVGDHGCEYMTEGVVVILGETGRNFGAGMSNGIAYVLDEAGDFETKLNPELVKAGGINDADEEIVQVLVRRHALLTGSQRAREILDGWDTYKPLFKKVAPKGAFLEDGAMTIVARHMASLREIDEDGRLPADRRAYVFG